jgi:dolichol-phosphate mannosyltransferase
MLVAQSLALVLLLHRLLPGRRRAPAVAPAPPRHDTTVSVIVATLNEAARIAPCLAGLAHQGAPLLEVIVVDSRSTDGTRELVASAALLDPRFRLVTDPPLPTGWIGKVWALETGLQHARGEWVLGIDADTAPAPGMISAIVGALHEQRLDVASFAPRFVGNSISERWLQPAMLVTLIYRTGAVGTRPLAPERVLANGQCFIARRSVLLANGGYGVAKASFSDDVTLARHLAARGARVGFLDGSRIIDVKSYESLGEMWREWGRSFDLKDGTAATRRWHDAAFVWLVMALPLPTLVVLAVLVIGLRVPVTPWLAALVAVNASIFGMRLFLVWAIRGHYAERGWTFWLSWLADIPAAVRLTLSTATSPNAWRGRTYSVS